MINTITIAYFSVFFLIGWIDENGHSKSHSEQVKTGIQNIKFLSPEELISKFNNGNSE